MGPPTTPRGAGPITIRNSAADTEGPLSGPGRSELLWAGACGVTADFASVYPAAVDLAGGHITTPIALRRPGADTAGSLASKAGAAGSESPSPACRPQGALGGAPGPAAQPQLSHKELDGRFPGVRADRPQGQHERDACFGIDSKPRSSSFEWGTP
jgi:hypothetical protein